MKLLEQLGDKFDVLKFNIDRNSPSLFLGAGIVLVIGGTIAACIATRKADKIFDEHMDRLQKINEDRDILKKIDAGESVPAGTVIKSEKEIGKETVKAYGVTIARLGKAYGIPALLEIAGIGCCVHSNTILQDRAAGIGALLVASNTAFRDYRQGVVNRFGDSVDKELRYGITEKEVAKKETDENGNETVVTEKLKVLEKANAPIDVYFFDSSSMYYEDDPFKNAAFLRQVQAYMNEKISRRAFANGGKGFVFKNEVLLEIWPDGSRLSKNGQHDGWIYDSSDPEQRKLVEEKRFIDLGIEEYSTEALHYIANERFRKGFESVAVIDLNTMGDVYSMM